MRDYKMALDAAALALEVLHALEDRVYDDGLVDEDELVGRARERLREALDALNDFARPMGAMGIAA
jgi:hypothetical protein